MSSEVMAFVRSGVAVTVATRDQDMRPAVTRGWGPEVSSDGRALQLLVIAPAGSQPRANLEGNGAIAVGLGLPTVARAVELKGVVDAVRDPEPAEIERAERHLRAFCAEAAQLGIPDRLSSRMFPPRANFVSVTFPIEEAFDQTPGPTAGRRL